MRCSHGLAGGRCGCDWGGVAGFISLLSEDGTAPLPPCPPALNAAAAAAAAAPAPSPAAAAAAAGVLLLRSSASELATAAFAARAHSTAGDTWPAVPLRGLLLAGTLPVPAAAGLLAQLTVSWGAELVCSFSNSAWLPLRAALRSRSQ